jgi:hypothetical protein
LSPIDSLPFHPMMKKEKQASPRTAPLLNLIRMNGVSCGYRLVYETLDSIDEVR